MQSIQGNIMMQPYVSLAEKARGSRGMPRVLLALAMWAITAAGAPPVRAEAQADDAANVVRSTIEELRAAVTRDEEQIESDPDQAMVLVDRIVSPHVDVQRASRLILGRHWRTATPAQQEQFVGNFKRLLLRTYAVHVSDYADAQVKYLSAATTGNDGTQAIVRTRVSRPAKEPAGVDYSMQRTDAGWMVYDVVVNGISIVSTFRSAVDAEIREYGIDGLIARLAAKTEKPLSS